jgi:putative oxidoreductase
MTDRSGLQSFVYALLRIVSGAMFSFHGIQKIFGVLTPPDHVPAVGSQFWIGGIIELVCGILIALGLFTRLAAFLASGMMAVAYFQFHWKLAMDGYKFLPAINGGELAVVYCFVFLLFAVSGAGAFSADSARGRA